jgi:hypothetical protein
MRSLVRRQFIPNESAFGRPETVARLGTRRVSLIDPLLTAVTVRFGAGKLKQRRDYSGSFIWRRNAL